MPDKTYKLIDLVGVSTNSIDDAISGAVKQAAKSLKGLDWFEVGEIRGLVQGGKVKEFQVKLKLGFRILSAAEMKSAGS
jgi:flavin-binding protein dodecin